MSLSFLLLHSTNPISKKLKRIATNASGPEAYSQKGYTEFLELRTIQNRCTFDSSGPSSSIPAGCRQSVVGALNCCGSDDQPQTRRNPEVFGTSNTSSLARCHSFPYPLRSSRSAGALSKGTKQVSTHTSNVTHVVTHLSIWPKFY